MSEKSTGETVFELDPAKLPTMTEEQMSRLRSMPDEDIDYSDTPSQVGKTGRRVMQPYGRRGEVIVLEPDVAEFFRVTGEVSSGRVNAALREYAEQQRKRA